MKYLVDVNYTITDDESIEVDVGSIGEITDDYLIDKLDLPANTKIVDFTINAR